MSELASGYAGLPCRYLLRKLFTIFTPNLAEAQQHDVMTTPFDWSRHRNIESVWRHNRLELEGVDSLVTIVALPLVLRWPTNRSHRAVDKSDARPKSLRSLCDSGHARIGCRREHTSAKHDLLVE